MQPPAYADQAGITSLPCIGDGRQSGTSGSPSILNASPEAAAGGGLALLQDRRPRAHRPQQGRADILISDEELARKRRAALRRRPAASRIPHQTPWQEIQRGMVDQLSEGMVLKPAVKYQRVARPRGCRATTIHVATLLARRLYYTTSYLVDLQQQSAGKREDLDLVDRILEQLVQKPEDAKGKRKK
jgi:hypothetical protein